MPKYIVESPSGQTLEIEGDAPPTEKELDDIFAAAAPADTPAPVEAPRLSDVERQKARGGPVIRNPRTGLPDLRDTSRMAEQLQTASTLGVRAGGPAIGQAAGALTGPAAPVAVPVLGAIGGVAGEFIADLIEDKPTSGGRLMGAAITGAVPGASLAKAGTQGVIREGTKLAVTNLGAKAVETIADEGRLPDAGEAAAQVAFGYGGGFLSRYLSRARTDSPHERLFEMRDETFKDVREFGIKVPPHELGKGSDIVSGIGGKAATQQQAAMDNIYGFQKAIREDLGLGREAVPIRPSELEKIRAEAAAPYQQIKKIQQIAKIDEARITDEINANLAAARKLDPTQSKAAEEAAEQANIPLQNRLNELKPFLDADIDALKKVREDKQAAWDAFRAGDSEAYKTYIAKREEENAIEDAIDKVAEVTGDSGLLQRLRDARKKIAKSYSAEEAINPGNGLIDPADYGRQLLTGVKLDGNAEKIAKFQLAFGRVSKEASRIPAPGVGNLGVLMSMNMISEGNAPGTIMSVVNATAGRAVRPLLLSDVVQEAMMNPVERQNFSAALARFLSEKSGDAAMERDTPEPVTTP